MARNTGWNIGLGVLGIGAGIYLGVQAKQSFDTVEGLRGRDVVAVNEAAHFLGDQVHIAKIVFDQMPSEWSPNPIDGRLEQTELQVVGALGSIMLGAGNFIALKR